MAICRPSSDPAHRIAYPNQIDSKASRLLFEDQASGGRMHLFSTGPLASPVSKSASESLWGLL
jgi:hypothetical protein